MPRPARYTGPDDEARIALLMRASWTCECCGERPCVDPHHRKARGMGGSSDPTINDLSNLLALCRECHDWVESNRAAARDKGWLVRPHQLSIATPAHLKIATIAGPRKRQWVLLTNDGRYRPAGAA